MPNVLNLKTSRSEAKPCRPPAANKATDPEPSTAPETSKCLYSRHNLLTSANTSKPRHKRHSHSNSEDGYNNGSEALASLTRLALFARAPDLELREAAGISG